MKVAMQPQMSQQIGMTPQLLQSIRLLHLSAMDVELEVARALEENPLLERVEAEADDANDEITGDAETSEDIDSEFADTTEPDDFDDFIPGEFGNAIRATDDYDPFEHIAASESGDVRANLRKQLALELSDARDLDIAAWLLDSIDDNGYLETSFETLAAQAAETFDIDAAKLESIRQRVMRCEPAGFGARDLRECLLVQLSECKDDSATIELAMLIVANHLDALADKNRGTLSTLLNVSAIDVEAAVALILTLDPKPGANYSTAEGRVVVPDVVVRRRGNGWHVALNAPASPRVRVDAEGERLLSQSGDGEGARRLRDLLAEARWMSRGLSMRYDTLLRTTRAIVERQAEFLEHGEEAMKPLILREIAAQIGMHESSISRITTGKYMQTPRGTFELKYFFSAKLEGSQVAGVAVRAMVKRLIDTENRAAPLADDTIVALLARRGVRVARRTVAKYRDILDIASAKERGLHHRPSVAFAAASL